MNEIHLDTLHQLSMKILPRLDDELMRRLLLVLILLSDPEKGAELKKVWLHYA